MEKKIERMAILIDGDNAQAKLLKDILEEVAKYGKVTIRRIYGDWTQQGMNSWKGLLNDLSFSPMQKFSYTSGKNSTDGALIIDAMDILHGKLVDGFCIVSSDSDYTGLAKRIREEGVFTMGIGEKKTPSAFVNSCEVFTFTENIVQEAVIEEEITVSPRKRGAKSKKAGSKETDVKEAESKDADGIKTAGKEVDKPVPQVPKFAKVPRELIDRAYFMSTPEDTGIFVSVLGGNLRKIDPSFDTRAHGFQTLTRLLESLKEYEVYKSENILHRMVKRKQRN